MYACVYIYIYIYIYVYNSEMNYATDSTDYTYHRLGWNFWELRHAQTDSLPAVDSFLGSRWSVRIVFFFHRVGKA